MPVDSLHWKERRLAELSESQCVPVKVDDTTLGSSETLHFDMTLHFLL